MSERCERTSEQRSEWPSTPRVYFIVILLIVQALPKSRFGGGPKSGSQVVRGGGAENARNTDSAKSMECDEDRDDRGKRSRSLGHGDVDCD